MKMSANQALVSNCHRCQAEIRAGDEFIHDSKVLCEDCYISIRSPRVRKTHWQYLTSIKTGYLKYPDQK